MLLKHLRTHAYETEDRRPDTNNIPTRAEYTAKSSFCAGGGTQQLGDGLLLCC